jgi:hypothetical protein
MKTAPKVFLSHASEDKSRFVTPFATALRAKGIDVWVDQWEILPGDSLVQRIFEEGLKNATAIIVVLSRFSVSKPWVREELDAAAVRRINTGSKLIPVVIEDCDVPQILQATVWERVADLDSIDIAVERVTAAIFNFRSKPPIGQAPSYAAETYSVLPGLEQIDAHVLLKAAAWAIENDTAHVDPRSLFLVAGSNGIAAETLSESIDLLEQEGYVDVIRHLGPGPYDFRLTEAGFELYLVNNFESYDAAVKEVIALIVNRDVMSSDQLAAQAQIPHRIAHHIVSRLEAGGHVKLSRTLSATARIFAIAPSLKRILR